MKMSGRRSKCPYFVSDTGPVDHDCRIGLSQKKRESVCVCVCSVAWEFGQREWSRVVIKYAVCSIFVVYFICGMKS